MNYCIDDLNDALKLMLFAAIALAMIILASGCASDKGYVNSTRGFAPLSIKWGQNTLIPEIEVMGYLAHDYVDCPAGGKIEIPQEYEIGGIKVVRTIKVDLTGTKAKVTLLENIKEEEKK